MLADVFQSFERPTHIFLGLVLFDRNFRLLRENDGFANARLTRIKLFDKMQKPLDRDRRTGDRLVGLDLAAFDALGDRDLALAVQKRHNTHFAKIQADGIVRFVENAG
ncbi:MAG: hypothetical protein JFAIHJKO_02796 [Pyrinomonadaceae bacterium]|nr:hypothetical protein [Pyrinomonadaceae bacterium]